MLQEFIPTVRFTEEQRDLLIQFIVEVWLRHKFTFFQGQFRITAQLGFQQRCCFQVYVSHKWVKAKKKLLNYLCKIGQWSHHSWFPIRSQYINISIIRFSILLNCLCALHLMKTPFDEIFVKKQVGSSKMGWWSSFFSSEADHIKELCTVLWKYLR